MSKKRKIALGVFYIIVFMSFLIFKGVRKCDDTDSYYNMALYREPLYGLLLRLFERIFHAKSYFAMGFFQNVLAIVTSYCLAEYTIRANRIKNLIVQCMVSLIVLAPYVLSIFFTVTHVFVPNVMMSEGIVVPLYNLLITFFLHYLWEDTLTNSQRIGLQVKIWCTMFVILMTRGQLIFSLIVWCLLELILLIQKVSKSKRDGQKQEVVSTCKNFGMFVLSIVLMLGIKSGIVGYCNLVFNGVWTQTTYTSTTFATNLIYLGEHEEGDTIEDEGIRNLYYSLYFECRKNGLKADFAPKEFHKEAEYFALTHDDIKMDFYQLRGLGYMEVTMPNATYEEKMIELDHISNEIIKGVLPNCFSKWFVLYWKNVAVGLVRSVMILKKWSYVPVISVYMFLIISSIHCYRVLKRIKGKEGMEEAIKSLQRVLRYFLLVTILTAGCVSSVALLIMCLSRYMVYNIALIYLAVLLLARELYLIKQRACLHAINNQCL